MRGEGDDTHPCLVQFSAVQWVLLKEWSWLILPGYNPPRGNRWNSFCVLTHVLTVILYSKFSLTGKSKWTLGSLQLKKMLFGTDSFPLDWDVWRWHGCLKGAIKDFPISGYDPQTWGQEFFVHTSITSWARWRCSEGQRESPGPRGGAGGAGAGTPLQRPGCASPSCSVHCDRSRQNHITPHQLGFSSPSPWVMLWTVGFLSVGWVFYLF